MTILLLEDEKPLREAIRAKLETEGFKVIDAKGVEQALSYFKKGIKIDAIWLDHYLFGKNDGLDFVSMLRLEKNTKNLPVFLVSNTISEEKCEAYKKLGVQKCYIKVDHTLDEIVGDIKKFLKVKSE